MRGLIAVVLILILAGSCNKSSQQDYHFRGRLVKDCSGTPLANQKLRLYQKTNLFGGGGGDKGFATTDAAGNFDLACPDLDGLGVYLTYGSGGAETGKIIDGEIPVASSGANGRTFELGTFYERAEFVAAVDIRTGNAGGSQDTLYYGQSRIDYKVIYPITPGVRREVYKYRGAYMSSAPDTLFARIYWGIGRKDFDSSLNYRLTHRADEPQYRLFRMTASLCAEGPAAVLDIP